MFELATVNELIQLKARYLDKIYPEEHEWGLKQFGTLFCFDQMNDITGSVLELGAGRNRFFDEHLPPSVDYWAVDNPGFYNEKEYRHSVSLRKRTTLVDGLVGDFLPTLPDGKFDVIFSISAIEHVPQAKVMDVCRDMFRLTRPGGRIVHTLDVPPSIHETVGKAYLEGLSEVGFRYEKPPYIAFDRISSEGILTEPAAIVFKYYKGVKANPWEKPVTVDEHTSSIKIIATRPA